MSTQHPQEEDTLSFEWAELEDPRNVSITLDEQHPGEALTLLGWLGEREATLFELTEQQTPVAPDQGP